MHFARNVLARVPKGSAAMVAAAICTIFAQPDANHVREQLDTNAGMLGRQFPAVETMLRDAEPELTMFGERPLLLAWRRPQMSAATGVGCGFRLPHSPTRQ